MCQSYTLTSAPVHESVYDQEQPHDSISPFSPLARDKRIQQLRSYPIKYIDRCMYTCSYNIDEIKGWWCRKIGGAMQFVT